MPASTPGQPGDAPHDNDGTRAYRDFFGLAAAYARLFLHHLLPALFLAWTAREDLSCKGLMDSLDTLNAGAREDDVLLVRMGFTPRESQALPSIAKRVSPRAAEAEAKTD